MQKHGAGRAGCAGFVGLNILDTDWFTVEEKLLLSVYFPASVPVASIMFDPDTGVATLKEGKASIFPHSDLEKATQGFSPVMRIGGGGSCEVFRGNLYNVDVAIKVLKHGTRGKNLDQDEVSESALTLEIKQFFAEMYLLQTVEHPNICRLLGVSSDGPNRW